MQMTPIKHPAIGTYRQRAPRGKQDVPLRERQTVLTPDQIIAPCPAVFFFPYYKRKHNLG